MNLYFFSTIRHDTVLVTDAFQVYSILTKLFIKDIFDILAHIFQMFLEHF